MRSEKPSKWIGQIRDEKLRQLFANQTIGNIANLVNAAILTLIQWHEVDHHLLVGWLAATLVVLSGRVLLKWRFQQRRPQTAQMGQWWGLFLAGTFCSGALWGAAGVLLFPVQSLVHQMFTAFTIGGMVAGAAAAYSAAPRAYLTFSLPAMLPVIIYSFNFLEHVHIAMSAMMLLFLLLMTTTCWRNHRINHASIKLKFENQDLIDYLSDAKAQSDQIACELKIENSERLKVECQLEKHQKTLESMVEQRTTELEERNRQLDEEIQERRRVQAALEDSEERYRLLVENANVGIILIHNEKVVFANAFTVKITGYTVKEIIDSPFLTFIHPDDRQTTAMHHLKRMQQEPAPEVYQVRLLAKTGEVRWIETTAARITIDNTPAALVFFRDITQQRQLEKQLLQSEKMAAIGQLAAGVAHEINNPVGFVDSNLHTLEGYMDDLRQMVDRYQDCYGDLKTALANGFEKPSIEEKVDAIEAFGEQIDLAYIFEDGPALIKESLEGTDRIKNIVMDLKDFAHPGKDDSQPMNINRCIESALNIVWNELKYHAEVTKELGELPEIIAHPQQINQVFINLLVNAAQAMEGKGEIRIQTGVRDGYVEVRISDTGCGIPDGNLSKIFDPFFTTKPVGKGTGLGLNVSYNIVQKHHGTIEVDSREGKGTTFTVRLPASVPPLEEATMQTDLPGQQPLA